MMRPPLYRQLCMTREVLEDCVIAQYRPWRHVTILGRLYRMVRREHRQRVNGFTSFRLEYIPAPHPAGERGA